MSLKEIMRKENLVMGNSACQGNNISHHQYQSGELWAFPNYLDKFELFMGKKHIFYHFQLNTKLQIYNLVKNYNGLLIPIYLSTTATGSITLEPCEITSSIRINKVWLRWLTYVEGNIIRPTQQKHEFRRLALQILNYDLQFICTDNIKQ